LLGQYGLLASSVFFYALVMLLISLCFGVLHYVTKLQPGERGNIVGLLRSRTAWNTLGPAVYALAMALAFVSPLASVLLIAAIAIFYMLPSTVSSALASGAANAGDDRS